MQKQIPAIYVSVYGHYTPSNLEVYRFWISVYDEFKFVPNLMPDAGCQGEIYTAFAVRVLQLDTSSNKQVTNHIAIQYK